MCVNINHRVLKEQSLQTHRGPRHGSRSGSVWMATGLTGAGPGWQVVRGSVEAQASLHVSGSRSPFQGAGESRHAQRGNCVLRGSGGGGGMLMATEVHVWFGLLLITVWHRVKPLSVATSSVKLVGAPVSCWDAGQVALLTALHFGCPLVKLELGEQGTILVVLLCKRKTVCVC